MARKLREDGVGASIKHVEVITSEEESQWWSKGALGVHSPTALLLSVFLNGKALCLRGREHKTLKISQFRFHSDEGGDYVVYQENGSKNRSGSYKDRAENKIIKHYADLTLQEKCYVHVLKCYLSQWTIHPLYYIKGQMKDRNIFHVKSGSLFNQLVATLSLLCLRACVKG